jgi:hypothetical protein
MESSITLLMRTAPLLARIHCFQYRGCATVGSVLACTKEDRRERIGYAILPSRSSTTRVARRSIR